MCQCHKDINQQEYFLELLSCQSSKWWYLLDHPVCIVTDNALGFWARNCTVIPEYSWVHPFHAVRSCFYFSELVYDSLSFGLWLCLFVVKILPHSALSWNLSSAEILARFSLQDRAMKWHYFCKNHHPGHLDLFPHFLSYLCNHWKDLSQISNVD